MSTWLDGPPAESPFARAMQSASHVLIIPNSTVPWNGFNKLDIVYSWIWVCLKIVYPYTQWLMIIIPMKNCYFIGGIPHFQTYPYCLLFGILCVQNPWIPLWHCADSLVTSSKPCLQTNATPRCSMYGIFTYIYPKNGPNVGKYSIHGASATANANYLVAASPHTAQQ